MPIRYVGRESFFHGKSLFEIARNLRNFGEGRYVVRKVSRRYEEPSFYQLTTVKPEMNSRGHIRGEAFGKKVYRGINYGVCRIDVGGKYDWILIPKDEEAELLESVKNVKPTPVRKALPPIKIPPLMEIIIRGTEKADGITVTDEDFWTTRKLVKTKYSNNRRKFEPVEVEEALS